MNKILFASLLSIACFTTVPSYGSTMISAHVINVGTYGSGNVYVTLDTPLNEAGCSGPYIELAANNPSVKAVLATAAISATTGVAVQVQTDGCLTSASSTITARGFFGILNH